MGKHRELIRLLSPFKSAEPGARTLAFAAMDTTSNARSQVLHLLSKNMAAQERLQAEVRETRIQNNGDDLNYDQLNALLYLNAICREALRLEAVFYIVPAILLTHPSDILLFCLVTHHERT